MNSLQNLIELVINYILNIRGSFIQLNKISLLISQFNRLNPLIEVVDALRNNLGQRLEINIADDKSDPDILSKLYDLKCNIIENGGKNGGI